MGYSTLKYDLPAVGSYKLPPLGKAADGAVLSSDGKQTKLHSLYQGKYTLLGFIYSNCGDINGCPLSSYVFYKIKSMMQKDPQLADKLRLLSLSFDPEINTSNIQTIGFSFGTGLKIRNVFRGAETLEISGIAAIGASENRNDPDAAFFDINEFGGNIRLTIPRLFSPFNTDKIIPKYMSPSTIMNLSATSQQNIGLDKQAISGVYSYNWYPSNTVTNTLELFNINFVKNLNTSNYFGVYTNSFSSLNSIARDINYIGNDESLFDSSLSNAYAPADVFINDVLAGNTPLTSSDNDFSTVNTIEERKERLTENNLIFSTSFDYKKDKRKNIFDNDFSVFKWRIELAGNLLTSISSIAGVPKN